LFGELRSISRFDARSQTSRKHTTLIETVSKVADGSAQALLRLLASIDATLRLTQLTHGEIDRFAGALTVVYGLLARCVELLTGLLQLGKRGFELALERSAALGHNAILRDCAPAQQQNKAKCPN